MTVRTEQTTQELEYLAGQWMGQHSKSVTFKGTNSTSQQSIRKQVSTVYVSDSEQDVVLVPVKNSISLESLPLTSQWTLTTDDSHEQPYLLNRVLAVDIPVPEWLQKIPSVPTNIVLELWVEPEEVTEVQANDPSAWILTLNTQKLYDNRFLAPLTQYFAGNPDLNYPTRWLIFLAGVLGPVLDRPKYVKLSVSFKTVQLTMNNLDIKILQNITAERAILLPPPGIGPLVEVNDVEDSWELVPACPL